MPVDRIALDEIFGPFLQLAPLSHLVRQQPVELTLQLSAEFSVAFEQFRSLDDRAEKVTQDGEVHGGPHANARRSFYTGLVRVLELNLRGDSSRSDQVAFAVIHQPVRA